MGLDGRLRPSDCANTEGVLRIVMSVPSPKAEPLKLWLAQMGKQAIDETENPELGLAGKARLLIEEEQGEKVVSKENFLTPLAKDKNALNEKL